MDGILLIDKPSGWSSFDVVAKVRGTLKREMGRKIKVGHTGTLDPLATGLMIIVVGTYCKRAQEFSKLDKTYEVTMELGCTTVTGDSEGDKEFVSDMQPEEAQITEVLRSFIGESMQVPPIFSAIKIDGKRAYKSARAGQEVVIEPRPIRINDIQFTDYRYPLVRFTADVASGTYIRSLVRDIGEHLETGAYMPALRRTVVGEYTISQAVSVEGITAHTIESSLIQ